MKLKRTGLITITIIFSFLVSGSSFAIIKVAPSMTMTEFSGGIAKPIGTYNRNVLTTFDFNGVLVDFNSADVYENGFNLDLAYGKLINRNWLVSAGLSYITHDYKNPMEQLIGDTLFSVTYVEKPKYRQYDLDININYLPFDLKKGGFSPYFGIGMAAGFAAATAKNVQAETDATFALRGNFGAEVKIWKSPGSFLTIASINSYDFYGSGTRAKHLQIGGGIRFYSR